MFPVYCVNHVRLAHFLVVLVVLTGCQSGPTEVQDTQNIEELRQGGEAEEQQQAEVASTPATAPSLHTAIVSAATWTDGEWPLTIDGGFSLAQNLGGGYQRQAVFITDQDGEMWPLNGVAKSHHARFGAKPELTPIWRVDQKIMDAFPNSEATIRISIDPLIKRGLSLCD